MNPRVGLRVEGPSSNPSLRWFCSARLLVYINASLTGPMEGVNGRTDLEGSLVPPPWRRAVERNKLDWRTISQVDGGCTVKWLGCAGSGISAQCLISFLEMLKNKWARCVPIFTQSSASLTLGRFPSLG
jgi:hypothetical protein